METRQLAEALRVLAEGQNALQTMVAAQREANEVQRQQMADQREQSAEEIRVLREELKRSAEQKGKNNLIDTKGLGKPNPFSGQLAEWEAWSFKFVTWMGAQFGEAEKILEMAASHQGAITEEVMDDFELNYPRTPVGEFNSQLYGVLVSLLDLGSEPM